MCWDIWECRQNTTDPVGVQVTEESSAGIVCTPEHLLQHSDSHVRDLGDLVESVVYTDGTRSEVVRINVKGTLDRDRVVQLWSTFEYILKHPAEVGFQCKTEPGLLQIEGIDFTKTETRDLRVVYSLYDQLLKVLKIANVARLRVEVYDNNVFSPLLQVLSSSGSLRELTLFNISDKTLLPRLTGVFHRHRHLTKLALKAHPVIREEFTSQEFNIGKETRKFFAPHKVSFGAETFMPLGELQELSLENIENSQLEEHLKYLASLKLFGITSPHLVDKIVEAYQTLSKQRGSGAGFKIRVGIALLSHETRERGSDGGGELNSKVFCKTKYAGKTWDPDQQSDH